MTRRTVVSVRDFVNAFYNGGDPLQRLIQGDMIAKDDPFLGSTTGFFVNTFGAKVWMATYSDVSALSAIPVEPWLENGWRVETTKPTASHGVDADSAALPATRKPTVVEVYGKPKYYPTNFDESIVAEFQASLPGGIGDLWGWARERMGLDHKECLDKMLFTQGGTATYQTTDLESLDRICANYDERTNAYESDQSTSFSANDLDPYSATALFDRDGGAGWTDAVVGHASKGGLRNLSIELIEDVLEDIKTNGGKTKVIITGNDTARKLAGLYYGYYAIPMSTAWVQATFNGVQGVQGMEAGAIPVAFYNRIPIITDVNCLADSGGISRMYFLDTDYLKFKVAMPTSYFEGGMSRGDPFSLGYLKTEGMFLTGGEIVCTNFKAQGKLRDLK